MKRFSESDLGPHCRIVSSMSLEVNLRNGPAKPISDGLLIKRIAESASRKKGVPAKNSISSSPADESSREVQKEKSPASSPWQEKLFSLLVSAGLSPLWEFQGAVKGRRFRIDMAFPEVKLAVEVDGWQYHGKTLSGFKADRKRQNLLVVNHWRVLRFFPEEISKNPDECVRLVKLAIGGEQNA